MHALGAIYRRELSAYFQTPLAYVFLAVFAFAAPAFPAAGRRPKNSGRDGQAASRAHHRRRHETQRQRVRSKRLAHRSLQHRQSSHRKNRHQKNESDMS